MTPEPDTPAAATLRVRLADPGVRLALVPAIALLAGLLLWLVDQRPTARVAWALAVAVVLTALVRQIMLSLRAGEVGLDVIAALAMAGALAGGEWLAGCVVALMYAGGQALESLAQARAQREMTALLARTPRRARALREGRYLDISVDDIRIGDQLLIAPGDVVPADGTVVDGVAVLDEQALTGESLPVSHPAGALVQSGTQNAGPSFHIRATARAAESAYARIVALVEAARRSKAPMSRLADRFGLAFLGVTLVLAGVAWIAAGDFHRALAVLVVATPCPLILAVPVAIVAGMSRAASQGIMVKSAAAFERLAGCRTLLVDKTGTLTLGAVALAKTSIENGYAEHEILRLAASLAQASRHVFSEAVVAEARLRGIELAAPDRVVETAGAGISGRVADQVVTIGRRDFVTGSPDVAGDGAAEMAIGVNGRLAAVLTMSDPVRDDAAATLKALRRHGLSRHVLVTGDTEAIARRVGEPLGFDAIHAGVAPEGKRALVARETRQAPTLMLGDGINDAAALAGASVGVAMGARGSAAAAEAADIVLLVDRLDRVASALVIARETRGIALQSVLFGMGLSMAAMAVAALGYLPPLAGALLQEAIDVAVVLNALRALRAGPQDQSVPG